MPTSKQKLDKFFSNYIRLRDAIEFHKKTKVDISFGQCCTCGKIGQWRYMDCGHFIGRGLGGSSGVRWDERVAHLQCKICNAFQQGAPATYLKFMLGKYGQKIVDELYLRHKVHKYTRLEIEGLGQYYKQEYQRMCREHNLKV